MHHLLDRLMHATAFAIPVVEHRLEREIAHWVHHDESVVRSTGPLADALTMERHLASAEEGGREGG